LEKLEKNIFSRFRRYLAIFSSLSLLLLLVVACSSDYTPTSSPLTQLKPSPSTNNTNTAAPQLTQGQLGPAPTPTLQLIGPTTGANGQITVMAPPADGMPISGHFYWVKDGTNIWGGGSGLGASLTTNNMGGQPIVKVPDVALSKDPMLSPDGTKLAYAYSPPPVKNPTTGKIEIGADIYVLDLTTKKAQLTVKRVDPEEFLEFPAWSPDGQTIYFASRAPSRQNGQVTGASLAIGSFDLKTQKRLDLITDASEPFAMPDGKSLVYIGIKASDDSYTQTLQLLNLATKQSKLLASQDQNFYQFRAPRPAPDGKNIVFGGIGGPDEVQIVTPGANANPTSVPTPASSGLLPNFASLLSFGLDTKVAPHPASPTLNIGNAHGLPWDLWMLAPTGEGLRRVTSLFEDEPIAAWSKDSQHLVFLAGNGFYTIDANGKNLHKKSNEGAHGGFTWQP
jgi:dipeptidyl aminopeptidase/acylaminoacyl peptidase